MAFAETANLAVKLTLGGNFQSQLKKATSDLKGFNKDASRGYKAGAQIGTGIKRGAAIAAAGVGILASQVAFGLDQLVELESLNAQTVAGLKSTKDASGQTAESIRNLSESFESLNATIDDKVIQNAANVLLTFTNVGKKAFTPAIQAALDMNTALGGGPEGLQGAILKVGKALNDPAKGFGALKKAGVQFNDAQLKILKGTNGLTKEEAKHYIQLLKTDKTAAKRYRDTLANNKLLASQKLILGELSKEFGGRFAAGGDTAAGKVAKFGDAIEDLQKSLAVALLPAVSNIADALNALLRDPATIKATEQLGKEIGKLFSPENIKKGIDLLKDGFNALKAIAGPIADIIGKAVGAFTSLPPDIQKLLVGGFVVNKVTGGLITNIFGGIADAIAKSFIKAPFVNVEGAVVNVNGGITGGGGGAGDLIPKAAAAAGGLSAATIAQIALVAAVPLIPLVAAYFLTQGQSDLPGRKDTAVARGLDPRKVPVTTQPGMQSPIADWANKQKTAAQDLNESARHVRDASKTFNAADASAARSVAAAAMRLDAQPAYVTVTVPSTVNVSVTAGGIKRTVAYTTRHGRSSGSHNGGQATSSGGDKWWNQ